MNQCHLGHWLDLLWQTHHKHICTKSQSASPHLYYQTPLSTSTSLQLAVDRAIQYEPEPTGSVLMICTADGPAVGSFKGPTVDNCSVYVYEDTDSLAWPCNNQLHYHPTNPHHGHPSPIYLTRFQRCGIQS